jgi:hypothetical protein
MAAPFLEDKNLFTASVFQHFSRNSGIFHIGFAYGKGFASKQEYLVHDDLTPDFGLKGRNAQVGAFLDAELFAAGFYDCVHVFLQKDRVRHLPSAASHVKRRATGKALRGLLAFARPGTARHKLHVAQPQALRGRMS